MKKHKTVLQKVQDFSNQFMNYNEFSQQKVLDNNTQLQRVYFYIISFNYGEIIFPGGFHPRHGGPPGVVLIFLLPFYGVAT